MAITLLAKGTAFLPGYSIDDYDRVLNDTPTLAFLLWKRGDKGRFGSALLNWGLQYLDFHPAHSRVVFVTLSLIAAALFATLVVRFWNLDRRGWLAPALACMIANHPFTVEIYSFRAAIGIALFPLAILCLMLVPRAPSPRRIAAGTLLFAVALSIYQIVLHSGLMVVLIGAAIGLTRVLVAASRHGWSSRFTSLLSPRRALRHRGFALLSAMGCGTVLYSIVAKLLSVALKLQLAPRTRILPPAQWLARAVTIRGEIEGRLLGPGPLLSPLLKGLLLAILAAALLGLLAQLRSRPHFRPAAIAALVVALACASFLWSYGVLLLLDEFWTAPRVLAHIAIFWAGILAIAYLTWGWLGRRILATLTALSLLSFVGANNRALNDQLRLNRRDALKASRIVGRLEMIPGFAEVHRVAFDGADWTYPRRFRSLDHDLNVSPFAAQWAQAETLSEITGYDLRIVEDEAGIAAAAAYCRGVEPWPGPRSVTIEDATAIVCLGPP